MSTPDLDAIRRRWQLDLPPAHRALGKADLPHWRTAWADVTALNDALLSAEARARDAERAAEEARSRATERERAFQCFLLDVGRLVSDKYA